MWWRAIIAGLVVASVSELADRFPRLGALLLTLPIVSIVAFIAVWNKEQDLTTVSRLARETLFSYRLACRCLFQSRSQNDLDSDSGLLWLQAS